jgi:hypothetical protein
MHSTDSDGMVIDLTGDGFGLGTGSKSTSDLEMDETGSDSSSSLSVYYDALEWQESQLQAFEPPPPSENDSASTVPSFGSTGQIGYGLADDYPNSRQTESLSPSHRQQGATNTPSRSSSETPYIMEEPERFGGRLSEGRSLSTPVSFSYER